MSTAVAAVAPLPASPLNAPGRLPATEIRWSPARRFAFRLLFAYVALYSFSLAGNSSFDWDWLTLNKVWHAIVPWVGKHVLHLSADITVFTNGSGDTRYDWLLDGVWAFLALVTAVVWSIVDRKRPHYQRLLAVLRVWVRYALAYQMLSYGCAKVFKLQFPMPGPARMRQTYGDSSPMGLLWTFMGASTAYTIFGGAAEVLGGVLVLFRRTATLGALVVVGVMSNVVMLNFCYDVPVKLLSLHLLLMAVWLLLPDGKRLVDVLILHRPTQPSLALWRPASRRGVWARRIVKLGLLGFVGWRLISSSLQGMRLYGDSAPKPPGYGMYEVEELIQGGKVVAQKKDDPKRWSTFVIGRFGGDIRLADGTRQQFSLPSDGRIELWTDDPANHYMSYTVADAEHIVLSGRFVPIDADVKVTLKRLDDKHFLLTNRGFHLISEAPFNR